MEIVNVNGRVEARFHGAFSPERIPHLSEIQGQCFLDPAPNTESLNNTEKLFFCHFMPQSPTLAMKLF